VNQRNSSGDIHPMSNSFYALILAGGSGMRFWPLSRRTNPKQLLRLFSNRTLLEETLDRLHGLVSQENVLILTNEEQEASVRKLLPKHPPENISCEPAKRDTAAAIALGVGLVAARDASATMAVLPADHRIPDRVAFQRDMRVAATAAEQTGDLVTIGVTPTWACPGFGYIERGRKTTGASADLFEVVRFREKPNSDLADSFVRSGNFYWNAGIFVWTVKAILTQLNRHAPDLAEFVSAIRHTNDREKILKERFPTLRKLSIDYAIMEKATRVLVKPATFEWDDVGNWAAIAKYLDQYPGENAANCRLTTDGASNNVVFSRRGIDVALLGVRDLIVVQTKDAILVCNRHEVESLKKLVATLPEELQ
jgi:mannose-1-phosphate guanylyltransferase